MARNLDVSPDHDQVIFNYKSSKKEISHEQALENCAEVNRAMCTFLWDCLDFYGSKVNIMSYTAYGKMLSSPSKLKVEGRPLLMLMYASNVTFADVLYISKNQSKIDLVHFQTKRASKHLTKTNFYEKLSEFQAIGNVKTCTGFNFNTIQDCFVAAIFIGICLAEGIEPDKITKLSSFCLENEVRPRLFTVLRSKILLLRGLNPSMNFINFYKRASQKGFDISSDRSDIGRRVG